MWKITITYKTEQSDYSTTADDESSARHWIASHQHQIENLGSIHCYEMSDSECEHHNKLIHCPNGY